MADEQRAIPVVDVAQEKKKLNEEKKKLKQDEKKRKKEAKARAKEIAKQEASLEDDSEGGAISAVVITIFIVLIWLAILCLLIKLDVGGFGSNVLRPLLKDVPVLNWILPADDTTETDDENAYDGYTSLREAVDQIHRLEQQLEQAQNISSADEEELTRLRAEVARLQTYEDNQVNFERLMNQFYEDVIYAENGPGIDAYIEYYESINPTTAEILYAQVIAEQQTSSQMQAFASAYAEMRPSEAAAIFEAMENDLELVADILGAMSAEKRGDILGAMTPAFAARITRLMSPSAN